ncbi:N-acetyltransferase [Bacillus sp. FJAT-22090]|uniref:GNAT family N-acetyltransferase n=1 Tax=Bacillus sp. FJAT-22090 TaxID=1581038 RepID=UPI0011A6AB35|nr:GNAT family N-acetyltransferase [Bacillus sp. FJAT-22090]
MIQILDHKEKGTAEQMLAVQLPAYQIEAELIQFDGIPQLNDTPQSIMISEEIFLGYFEHSALAGFLSYTETDELIDICRLVVHPSHFRKGIASSLLKHLLSTKKMHQGVIVATGAKNKPAIKLYEHFGFAKMKEIEVEPNFFITQLSYRGV